MEDTAPVTLINETNNLLELAWNNAQRGAAFKVEGSFILGARIDRQVAEEHPDTKGIYSPEHTVTAAEFRRMLHVSTTGPAIRALIDDRKIRVSAGADAVQELLASA